MDIRNSLTILPRFHKTQELSENEPLRRVGDVDLFHDGRSPFVDPGMPVGNIKDPRVPTIERERVPKPSPIGTVGRMGRTARNGEGWTSRAANMY